MKFFLDTANIDQIKEANDLGILDGVTTNPSLMAKEGITGQKNIYKHYKDIAKIVSGDVSAEVISTDYAGMMKEALSLVEIGDNIIVKIPMIKDGVKAMRSLSDKGIATNCTLVFSAGQSILAAKAGAKYVSPFVGRLDDINTDGMAVVEEITQIYAVQGFTTEVLVASVRSPLHIVKAAQIGADVVTCPLKAILALLDHPLTDKGLATFLADYKASQAKK